jgi:hypothetical protein
MRKLSIFGASALLFVTLGALGASTPASAQGAWCAQYSGESGGTNCGFYTYGQCRAAVSGVGGFCSTSPYARYNWGRSAYASYGNWGRPQPWRTMRRYW